MIPIPLISHAVAALAAAAAAWAWQANSYGREIANLHTDQAQATARRAIRTLDAAIDARATEQALRDAAAEQQRIKHDKDRRIAAGLAAELDRLRNRPEQRAADRPGDPTDSAATGVGCTGAGLARGDAAFLAGYAADASRLAAEFERCTTGYDRAVKALNRHDQPSKN